MPTTSLGARLRALRGQSGHSQQDLATVAQVAQRTVSSWENDASSPNAEELARLARHFSCTTDYLCGLTDSQSPLPPDHWLVDLEMVDAIRNESFPPHLDPGTHGYYVAVPRRHAVLSSAEFARLTAELDPHLQRIRNPKKRRR